VPVPSPPDRPARHPHPHRPRRRRVHHRRPTRSTHDHRPLNHDADIRGEDRWSTVTDDGHQPWPAPSSALSDRATTGNPVTTDGPVRLSGRTPARGPPDQSSCRGREPRPTAIGKSGCHLATTRTATHPTTTEEPRLHRPTTASENPPSPNGPDSAHCINHFKQSRNYPCLKSTDVASDPYDRVVKLKVIAVHPI
jgi:hypothetical protein